MYSSWRRKSEVFFYFFKFIIEAFQGVEVANYMTLFLTSHEQIEWATKLREPHEKH